VLEGAAERAVVQDVEDAGHDAAADIDPAGGQEGDALTFLATGGVYIGGGIVPRILDVLNDGTFRRALDR
jgi:glucokinase